jgi:hypothetical protein
LLLEMSGGRAASTVLLNQLQLLLRLLLLPLLLQPHLL